MTYRAVDPADFRAAMSQFASGVTVVATLDGGGVPAGFTASAFSSLSLEPPLVLVCLDRRAECFDAFATCEAMGISILAEGQATIATVFATRGADKFGESPIEKGRVTGMPLVAGALAQVECEMHERFDGGDHLILVGRVVQASAAEERPLLHYNRSFGRFVAD